MKHPILTLTATTVAVVIAAVVCSMASVGVVADAAVAPLEDFVSVWFHQMEASETPALPAPQPSSGHPLPTENLDGRAGTASQRPPATKGRRDKVAAGILVRRELVAEAVQRGIRPSAVVVEAHGDRPGGLQVSGWQAAGAGLVDGDIVTHVAGRKPRSVDDVINAVVAAYKRQPAAISGRLWRNGRELQVTVELPVMTTEVSEKRGERPGPNLSQRR